MKRNFSDGKKREITGLISDAVIIGSALSQRAGLPGNHGEALGWTGTGSLYQAADTYQKKMKDRNDKEKKEIEDLFTKEQENDSTFGNAMTSTLIPAIEATNEFIIKVRNSIGSLNVNSGKGGVHHALGQPFMKMLDAQTLNSEAMKNSGAKAFAACKSKSDFEKYLKDSIKAAAGINMLQASGVNESFVKDMLENDTELAGALKDIKGGAKVGKNIFKIAEEFFAYKNSIYGKGGVLATLKAYKNSLGANWKGWGAVLDDFTGMENIKNLKKGFDGMGKALDKMDIVERLANNPMMKHLDDTKAAAFFKKYTNEFFENGSKVGKGIFGAANKVATVACIGIDAKSAWDASKAMGGDNFAAGGQAASQVVFGLTDVAAGAAASKIGAAIGTAICPGLGTVVGIGIGIAASAGLNWLKNQDFDGDGRNVAQEVGDGIGNFFKSVFG